MKKRNITIFVVAAFLFMSVPVFAQDTKAQVENPKLKSILSKKIDSWVYTALMDLNPAISYEGDITGLPATKPLKGKKINPKSAHVKKYRNFLKAKHDAALKAVGVKTDKKIYDFSVALNGFVVQLNKAQANKLAKQPGVVRVRPDEIRYKTTENTPVFLGVTDAAGAWARGATGENVVVGIIDTGIWPEHQALPTTAVTVRHR